MIDTDLAEQLEYSSSKWIYIVTWNNVLKQLITPFKVRVLSTVGGHQKGAVVWVESVKVTPQLKTVFIIQGKAYYYHHFDFVLE